MQIAVGMTVAPRVDGDKVYYYAAQAADSLRDAGCAVPPVIFAEPGSAAFIPTWHASVVTNSDTRGCFQNFVHGLQWLVDNTDAEWLLMLQDDAVWRPQSFDRLIDGMRNYPSVGFLSAYTSKAMVPRMLRDKKKPGYTWQPAKFHNNSFWGALAMCFPRASAVSLLQCQRVITHTHTRKVDVVVGNAMRRDMGLDILVSVPSLCQHIGDYSTLGRHKIKGLQWGRKGVGFP